MLPDRAREGLVQRRLADIHPSSLVRRMSDAMVVRYEVSDILVLRDLLFFFGPVGVDKAQGLGRSPGVALTEEIPELMQVFGLDDFTVYYSVFGHVGSL